VLVLGGTRFVGRAVVEEALARGWSVTVLNRGTHPAPASVTVLRGDRTAPGGLAAIEQGSWDVVVDTWSAAPSAVRDAAELLKELAGHYVYVSSRSVYAFPAPAAADEDAPLVSGSRDDGDVDYARAKAGGEAAVTTAFGEGALLVRAGLILGPYEDVGRLPWWLERIARGGAVLAPGPADLGLQFIDARDLAAWALTSAERQLGGPYNVVSEPGHTTMQRLLETCVEVTGADAELRWTDPAEILAAGIRPWNDLPLWIPPGDAYDAMHQAAVSKATAAGLRCRAAAETVTDTWAWLQDLGSRPMLRHDRLAVGLDPAVEARVLAGSQAR
jgi:2'-hydroxyisoflavone reductase